MKTSRSGQTGNTSHPSLEFEAAVLGPYSELVILALKFGLAYFDFPDRITDALIAHGINPRIISDEVIRQIEQMPSVAIH